MTALTPYEISLLRKLRDGKTYKEMGKPGTLSARFYVIRLKMNVKTNTQAVANAIGNGIIE